jgi:L-2-hydroxyglutarate oxidase
VAAYVSSQLYDGAIVGGGIVGLATARALSGRHPSLRLVILEKEDELATHQTGHNSGVIHTGIYYKPGSLKATLCVQGVERLIAFCDAHGIAYERCGKVIVATDESEIPALEELHRRGVANGVPDLEMIGPEQLHELEPHAAGISALHSPTTAIVDFREVANAMAADLRAKGTDIVTGTKVTGARRDGERIRIETKGSEVTTRFVVNCAGLYADRIARMMGADPDVQIVPFRGEYYFLRPERQNLVRGLIYPVPDPQFPFLGVHFTRTVHGGIEAGPNAVLAFAREGYTKGRIRPRELWEIARYPGFRAVARRYWRVGLGEYRRSFSKRAFVKALRRLVPDLAYNDVVRGGAGVRAQAVGREGAMLDDFSIVRSDSAIHVLNAPSPAATSSLAIGDHIAGLVEEQFL